MKEFVKRTEKYRVFIYSVFLVGIVFCNYLLSGIWIPILVSIFGTLTLYYTSLVFCIDREKRDLNEENKLVIQKEIIKLTEKLDSNSEKLQRKIESTDTEIRSNFEYLGKNLNALNLKLTDLIKSNQSQSDEIFQQVTVGIKDVKESRELQTKELKQYFENISRSVKDDFKEIQKINSEKESEKINAAVEGINVICSSLIEENREMQNQQSRLLEKHELVYDNVHFLRSQISNVKMLLSSLESEENILYQRFGGKEVIEDKENNLKVINSYLPLNSELYESGILKYRVENDENGKMILSQNYSSIGEVVTEISYHPNGQVKERTEWISRDGEIVKETKRFDE